MIREVSHVCLILYLFTLKVSSLCLFILQVSSLCLSKPVVVSLNIDIVSIHLKGFKSVVFSL